MSRAKLKSFIQWKHGGDKEILVQKAPGKVHLESVGDVGHKVLHDVARCAHGQLVGQVPVVIVHPTPVLHLGKRRV